MKFRYVMRENERVPWYYGAAWPADWGLVYVCYPVPFHWLMRWGRELWRAIRGPSYVARHDLAMLQVAYRQGWTECERSYQARIEEIARELKALRESIESR